GGGHGGGGGGWGKGGGGGGGRGRAIGFFITRGLEMVIRARSARSSSATIETEPGGRCMPPSMFSTRFCTSGTVFSPAGSASVPSTLCPAALVVRARAPPRP